MTSLPTTRGGSCVIATFRLGVNMEYVRSADKPFEWGVAKAHELGYEYVEPMVHTGWELLSEVDYFHSFSMEEDPLLMKEILADQDRELFLSAECGTVDQAARSIEYLTPLIEAANT